MFLWGLLLNKGTSFLAIILDHNQNMGMKSLSFYCQDKQPLGLGQQFNVFVQKTNAGLAIDLKAMSKHVPLFCDASNVDCWSSICFCEFCSTRFCFNFFLVVSEPFHASCQESIPPLLQNCLILLVNLDKHSQSHQSFIMWRKVLSI